MNERLRLDPDALRTAADRCSWVAGDLEVALGHLHDGMAALGDICGDDDAGRTFAADHDVARDRIVAAVSNLAECAAGMAAGLDAMATTSEEAEAASTVGLVRAS